MVFRENPYILARFRIITLFFHDNSWTSLLRAKVHPYNARYVISPQQSAARESGCENSAPIYISKVFYRSERLNYMLGGIIINSPNFTSVTEVTMWHIYPYFRYALVTGSSQGTYSVVTYSDVTCWWVNNQFQTTKEIMLIPPSIVVYYLWTNLF